LINQHDGYAVGDSVAQVAIITAETTVWLILGEFAFAGRAAQDLGKEW
jgi:hypothetical protein